MQKSLITLLVLILAGLLRAIPPEDAQKLYEKVTPSLVAVQYTFDSEAGRRDFVGAGIVIGEEGIVMASIVLFPPQLPDEQMKDFKIIVPGDPEQELEAEFLGRDERSEMAFLKTKKPQKWAAVKFEDAPLKVGEPIVSVGLLPKEAAYKSFYCESSVSALLRGPVPLVLTTTGGVAPVGSPVFNGEGKAVGFVNYQTGAFFFLSGSSNTPLQGLSTPPRYFTLAKDFLPSLSSMPTIENPVKLPWLGATLTAVRKDVAEFYELKNVPAAQVGEIIPDMAAAKAGLKASDKIIKVNGQALHRGDDVEETPRILLREIRRMKVGDTLKLTVVREKGKEPVEVAVTLMEQPRRSNAAKRHYAEDLGLSVREIVFEDTYAKKVPADTKGVVVAYLRDASGAKSAGLRNGDIVVEINKSPVTDLESFKKQLTDFRKASPKEVVVLMVLRERGNEVIKIEPPQ